jgi:hypothetical protein
MRNLKGIGRWVVEGQRGEGGGQKSEIREQRAEGKGGEERG